MTTSSAPTVVRARRVRRRTGLRRGDIHTADYGRIADAESLTCFRGNTSGVYVMTVPGEQQPLLQRRRTCELQMAELPVGRREGGRASSTSDCSQSYLNDSLLLDNSMIRAGSRDRRRIVPAGPRRPCRSVRPSRDTCVWPRDLESANAGDFVPLQIPATTCGQSGLRPARLDI